jgi:hypothetical protein
MYKELRLRGRDGKYIHPLILTPFPHPQKTPEVPLVLLSIQPGVAQNLSGQTSSSSVTVSVLAVELNSICNAG